MVIANADVLDVRQCTDCRIDFDNSLLGNSIQYISEFVSSWTCEHEYTVLFYYYYLTFIPLLLALHSITFQLFQDFVSSALLTKKRSLISPSKQEANGQPMNSYADSP